MPTTSLCFRAHLRPASTVGVRCARQRARLLERLAPRLTRRGELVVHADPTRSRARNRERARDRLAQLVREALVVRRMRIATRPTRPAREGRLAEKRRRAAVKKRRGPVRPDEH